MVTAPREAAGGRGGSTYLVEQDKVLANPQELGQRKGDYCEAVGDEVVVRGEPELKLALHVAVHLGKDGAGHLHAISNG